MSNLEMRDTFQTTFPNISETKQINKFKSFYDRVLPSPRQMGATSYMSNYRSPPLNTEASNNQMYVTHADGFKLDELVEKNQKLK